MSDPARTMKLQPYLASYTKWADEYLAHLDRPRESITTGLDAWTVAHRAGIARHAYSISPSVYDAHIQTALEHIFPNAVFKDPKRY